MNDVQTTMTTLRGLRRWRHRCLCRFKSISRTPQTCVVWAKKRIKRDGVGERGERYTQKLFAFTTRRVSTNIYIHPSPPLSPYSGRKSSTYIYIYIYIDVCVCVGAYTATHKIALEVLMCVYIYVHCCCCGAYIYTTRL